METLSRAEVTRPICALPFWLSLAVVPLAQAGAAFWRLDLILLPRSMRGACLRCWMR